MKPAKLEIAATLIQDDVTGCRSGLRCRTGSGATIPALLDGNIQQRQRSQR
jgi:hypothetical protein